MSELPWVVLRAATLVPLLQCAGAVLFLALRARLPPHSVLAIRRTAARAALAALVLVAGQLLLEPVHLAGEWGGATDPALYRMTLSSTLGAALGTRLAGLALITLTLRADGTAAWGAALAGAALALASFLLSGHTSMSPYRGLLAALLFIHLLAVAYWFGSMQPLRQLCAQEPPAVAARAVQAFSSVALWLVPVIPLAGAGMAVLLLPDAAALLRPYGLLLGAKVALFSALMGLAAYNRLRLTPALHGGAATAAMRLLRRTVAAEYALLCVTLVVTAVLTGLYSPAPGG